MARVPRTNTRRRYGRHPPVTVLFNTGVPPTALDSSDWFADSPLTDNDPYLGRLLRRPGRLGVGAPVRMASIEAGHGILRFYHAARQRTHGERIGGQTVRPHKCSQIRSGHPKHLDRSALPNATANPQRPHHHERPRQQHFCPVMDATCSQNQTASSTQLSSFSTSFAHPLSFTYSSPGKLPPWKRKHHSGPSVALLDGSIVGVRYRANIPNARSLQPLPSPARAAVAACALAQVRRQRGDVRHRNDTTVDTRARIFTQWLAHLSFDDYSLRTLTPGQGLPLLGAFIHAVANEGFSSTGRLNLGADTIRGYLRGAKDRVATRLQLVVDISAADGSGKLHPFLSDMLSSRQTWTEPKEKREAFTSAMFDYMFNDILSKAAKDTSALFDMEAAIFDWTRLGVFTGSRVSEYAQTTARKGTFSKVPDSLDAAGFDCPSAPVGISSDNLKASGLPIPLAQPTASTQYAQQKAISTTATATTASQQCILWKPCRQSSY